jgi:sugar (pentulose or hexulose) kinase
MSAWDWSPPPARRVGIELDGFVALVEEVEHLAGVELGALAEPVAAGGLSGGFEVVAGGVGDLVLSALGVGEAEEGHLEAGLVEVAGLLPRRRGRTL